VARDTWERSTEHRVLVFTDLSDAQRNIDRAIARTPSGELRDQITDINIRLLSVMDEVKKMLGEPRA